MIRNLSEIRFFTALKIWFFLFVFVLSFHFLNISWIASYYGTPLFVSAVLVKVCIDLFVLHLVIYAYYLWNQRRPKTLPLHQHLSRFLEARSGILFWAVIFGLLVFFKLLFLQFDLNPSMDSYREILDDAFYRNQWFMDSDDSPIYTLILLVTSKLIGHIDYRVNIFVNILIGSAGLLAILKLIDLIFKNRLMVLFASICLAWFATFPFWEAALRYDVLLWASHAWFVVSVFRYAIEPTNRNLAWVGVLGFLAASAKETVFYLMPACVAILVFVLWRQKMAFRKILIVALVVAAPVFVSKKIRDVVNQKKFGVTSLKRDDVLLVNEIFYGLLTPDGKTRYPETRDRLWKAYSEKYTEVERNENVIQKTDDIAKWHAFTNPIIYHRNAEGAYDHGLTPFLEELFYSHPFVFLKNAGIKFLSMVGFTGYAWPDRLNYKVGEFVNDWSWFRDYNHLAADFIYVYWFVILVLLIFTRLQPLRFNQKLFLYGVSFYCLYYGFFMSTATYAEFHRLMIPAHFFMVPLLAFVVPILYGFASTSRSSSAHSNPA